MFLDTRQVIALLKAIYWQHCFGQTKSQQDFVISD
jgi:hypothetical protein